MSNRHGTTGHLAAAVALQHSTPPTIRVLHLADGTTVLHTVGPIAWQDAHRYTSTTTTEDDK